ncbi:DNA repair exonuclease, SbcD subunit [Salisediminibacterium beveridgei]|uniref:Nuclease SbcCD subunit D n=2 Tax=Salisediminibacterium beveridgei TaxID=632773 RepID=A0A1D7QX65_9BACI|nr:DNA repair exonuclease, SbcD subunit [Salisediminibacterium beveridgei]
MTEDQAYILDEFIKAVEDERPDAIIIAGDLYDRAVPPTEAVNLLDDVLGHLVLTLNTPVIAIAGNHDSPSRLNFASSIMEAKGYHVTGQLSESMEPVILNDEYGEVHFHLVPYADPSQIRQLTGDDEVRSHNDAMAKITTLIKEKMDPNARHVFVGHAFVTPHGEAKENTSESERTLSVGGAEHVSSEHFSGFHYTALGHLHQAHLVKHDAIRYAGSPLKYSSSEETHKKGFFAVELDASGEVTSEKRFLTPRRDLRILTGSLDELLEKEPSEDYVFVHLTDDTPVLSPMEKIRSVFPNALHVQREMKSMPHASLTPASTKERHQMDHLSLFKGFYQEVKGKELTGRAEDIFKELLEEFTREEREQ